MWSQQGFRLDNTDNDQTGNQIKTWAYKGIKRILNSLLAICRLAVYVQELEVTTESLSSEESVGDNRGRGFQHGWVLLQEIQTLNVYMVLHTKIIRDFPSFIQSLTISSCHGFICSELLQQHARFVILLIGFKELACELSNAKIKSQFAEDSQRGCPEHVHQLQEYQQN